MPIIAALLLVYIAYLFSILTSSIKNRAEIVPGIIFYFELLPYFKYNILTV